MEIEQVMTLATVRGIGRVGWDALGESLLVEVQAGKPEGPLRTIPLSMTAEAAEELQALLRMCLLGKEDEAGPMQ